MEYNSYLRMKIVLATMFEENGGGGMGRVPHEMAEAFAVDHEVLFIYPGKVTRQKKEGKLWRLLIGSKGEGDVMIPTLSKRNIRLIFNCLEKFSPEVVHVHDPGPVSFLLQMWANKSKTPFVYTSHVLPTKIVNFGANELGKISRILDSKVAKRYFSYFFSHCQGVVALNQRAKEDILRFGYKGEIFLVPNGRNLAKYWQEKIFTKKNELVFVGYLTRRKNQRYLVEVMRYLPKDYSLKLVGPAINSNYLTELERLVERYHLRNVAFLGGVSHQKIPEILREAKVFVSASQMEVQSLAILEALASGTPVVGLSNETVDEFIDESCGFWLPKKTSPKDFAKKVKEICSLPEKEYEKLRRNARGKVEHLDWREIVEKTVAVYQKLGGRDEREKGFSSSWQLERDFQKKMPGFYFSRGKRLKKVGKEDVYLFGLMVGSLLASFFYTLKSSWDVWKRKFAFSLTG